MAEFNSTVQRKYLLQQIESASAIGRVILLYDACNRFLGEAKDLLIRNNNKMMFQEKLTRAKNIIRELRNALNIDLEPAVAGNFYRLYTYFLKRLNEANRTKDYSHIDFVVRQMTKLNDAWKEVEEKGLAKDVRRHEERVGTAEANIIRRVMPNASRVAVEAEQSGDTLLETLNLKV